ncbi:MAG: hypothetical protein ACR2JF_01295 [Iamia sp.]
MLSFNTVTHPDHMSLRTMSSEELLLVHEELSNATFDVPAGADPNRCRDNVEAFEGVVRQVAAWLRDAPAEHRVAITRRSR